MRFRTETVPEGGLQLPGTRIHDAHIAVADGALTFVLNPPAQRRWGPYGDLLDARKVDWELSASEGGSLLAAEAGTEVDLLDLDGDAAAAFLSDSVDPMTVVPDFEPFGGARELGRYLVGGRVLTGTETIKKPIDSTSLSLYRTARLRGGPLWDGVAAHVAGAAADRIEAAGEGGLRHDMWSAGETHIRFVNDALLLMAAHAELTGEERWRDAASRVCGFLEGYTVPLGGGRWVLHDSLERDDGNNDVVLNTHLQAVLALMAAGRDVDPYLVAAEEVLTPETGSAAALRASAAIGLLETVRARGPRRVIRQRVSKTYKRAALVAASARALRFPGGWLARDLSGRRAPGRYLTVNLGDLATLAASMDSPPPILRQRLAEGLRFAERSGFFRAEFRDATPMSVLIPSVLRLAGEHERAAAAAERALSAGSAPIVGWPGYEDQLWSRLGAGTAL